MSEFVSVRVTSADAPGAISLRGAYGWTLTLPRGESASWSAEMMRALRWKFQHNRSVSCGHVAAIDGLSLHVQQVLGRPQCDGTPYVFANRNRTRLKLVCSVRALQLS